MWYLLSYECYNGTARAMTKMGAVWRISQARQANWKLQPLLGSLQPAPSLQGFLCSGKRATAWNGWRGRQDGSSPRSFSRPKKSVAPQFFGAGKIGRQLQLEVRRRCLPGQEGDTRSAPAARFFVCVACFLPFPLVRPCIRNITA